MTSRLSRPAVEDSNGRIYNGRRMGQIMLDYMGIAWHSFFFAGPLRFGKGTHGYGLSYEGLLYPRTGWLQQK